VVAADVDGDDDIDVISADFFSVAWYENLDGKGKFGSQKRPIASVKEGQQVFAMDVDGDGDIDVISSALGFDGIGWHENLDSKGTFGPRQFIGGGCEILSITDTNSVYGTDLDGDADVDFLSASSTECKQKVTWYEKRFVGDSNDDGVFNSSDLVIVFTAGEYEDGIPGNSTFEDGDWNVDGDFRTSDLVFAFQSGMYVAASVPDRSDIASAIAFEPGSNGSSIPRNDSPISTGSSPKDAPPRTKHGAIEFTDRVFSLFHDTNNRKTIRYSDRELEVPPTVVDEFFFQASHP
jgi:hypothetical protein